MQDGTHETVLVEERSGDTRRSLGELIQREWTWMRSFVCGWVGRLIILTFWMTPPLALVYAFVWALSHGQIYSSVEDVPVRYVGLVPGCAEKVGDQDNAYFLARVAAAQRLLEAGKVQFLIVSGHPDRDGCNEPLAMKAALVARGVPADRVYCDFGGGRTLDSVDRVRHVFGQRDMTIISQEFHNQRAVYIARRRGLPDAVAFNAQDVAGPWVIQSRIKEVLARVLAVWDVEVSKVQPSSSGEKMNVGPHWRPSDASAPQS